MADKPWPRVDPALVECVKEWVNHNAPTLKDGATPDDAFRALSRWEGLTMVLAKLDAVSKSQRRAAEEE